MRNQIYKLMLLAFITQGAFSQTIDITLNPEGTFFYLKTLKSKTQNQSQCNAIAGTYKKGICTQVEASEINIYKNFEGLLEVDIETKATNDESCGYFGPLKAINKVQYVSKQGACKVEIRFESKNTLSVVTSEQCLELCSKDKAFLNTNQAFRQQ